jgi:ABC-type multidrug transport system ATPase subunit
MSLLELERVCKRYGQGAHERVVLREISFEIDRGEVAAVWGQRRSGRSTLLRIAAGLERADGGSVRFAGCDLGSREGEESRSAIAYCPKSFCSAMGDLVVDQLISVQVARGVSTPLARQRASRALVRAGAESCAVRKASELDTADAVRVAIARGLAREPKLLVIDEPTLGVDLLARDGILRLLRSLAADDGIAVLTSASDSTGLIGVDRALALSAGELRGSLAPELAPVVPLRRPA